MSHAAPDVDYQRLVELLTAERLGSYLKASGGDLTGAFLLYEWNMQAAASALSLAAMVEVLLRNALDREMRAWAAAKGHDDWLTSAPLDDRARVDVRKARERAMRGGRTATHGHVVAELNLGFWRYLVARKYLTNLWIPALQRAFPHAEPDARQRQKSLERHVQQLLYLRNRAAHHEPLHRRDLLKDLQQSLVVVSAIDPVAYAWVAKKQTLEEVVARRPDVGLPS